MKKGLVIFSYDKPNRYTWAILLGSIDKDPAILAEYDFHSLKFQLYQSPLHLQEVYAIPWQQYDRIIIAYSLMSIQIPQFIEFQTHYPDFFDAFHSNIIQIAGGSHVSADPLFFTPYKIDFLIPGEGELAFLFLLHALTRFPKSEVNVEDISGVDRGYPRYQPGPPAELISLGDFPSFSPTFRLFGPIEISRGCPFRCKFCQTGNTSLRMRHAPVEKLIHWIQLGAQLKYDKLWFLTPNAFAYGSTNGITPNPPKLYELLSKIRTIPQIKGIYFGTFPSEVRPESVTYDVLETVVPFLTNKKILIGAQTASNELLKKMTRGHTIEDVRRAIDLLNQFNLKCEIDFIFGLPGETEDDIGATIQFFEDVLENRIKNVKIHTHTFMPLPGTPLADADPGVVHPKLQIITGKLAKEHKAYGEYQAQAGIVETRYNKKFMDE